MVLSSLEVVPRLADGLVDVEKFNEEGHNIELGADYVYIGMYPPKCEGHLYRPHRYVLDVPTYQKKVLVEALTGKDKGLWFVCSLNNFKVRYRLAEPGSVKDAFDLVKSYT